MRDFLAVIGVRPKPDAWSVTVGRFFKQDVLFFDEEQARRHGRARPLVVPDDEDEEEEEQTGPFGGFAQTSHTLGRTAWASGFGARG